MEKELEGKIQEMTRMITALEQKVTLFEAYIQSCHMEAAYQRFCEEQRQIQRQESLKKEQQKKKMLVKVV